jgi:hypothetical protein
LVRRFLLIAALVLAGSKDPAYIQTFAQQPPRDAAATAIGTAVVRGRVVAAVNGQPLHRVRITLNGLADNPPSGVTDTRGEFEITGVPAGTYTLTAARAGYLSQSYGQRRPREAPRPIVIAAGQTIDKIEIAMVRGGVLAGRILDDAGEPAPGVRVEALEPRVIRGRRVFVAARIATTNDAGEYRVSGLDPGFYQVRATSREIWESDDGKNTFVFAPTFFPGVVGSEQVQSLTLAPGQEIGGLDFSFVAARAARVTGVVQDAAGTPIPNVIVNLSDIGRTIGGAIMSSGQGATTRTDARGAFDIQKLPAGDYMASSGGPNDRVSESFFIQPGEVKHVVLTPAKPVAIAGSVVVEGDERLPVPLARLNVDAIDADPTHVLPTWTTPRPTQPRADGTFRFTNVSGQYLFRIGLPEGWTLRAVRWGGRDMTDIPLHVTPGMPDVEGVQLVIAKGGATITGDVVDGARQPSVDAVVVVFSESRAQWGIASRFVRSARPEDRTGRFSVSGLTPGVYRVIAREFVAEGQWEDPEFLQSLLRDAARVQLGEGATEKMTLTIREAK